MDRQHTTCLYSLETEEVTLHILTESPTVPRPKMATVDPFDTSATFQAAPSPVNRLELVMNKHHLSNQTGWLKLNLICYKIGNVKKKTATDSNLSPRTCDTSRHMKHRYIHGCVWHCVCVCVYEGMDLDQCQVRFQTNALAHVWVLQ